MHNNVRIIAFLMQGVAFLVFIAGTAFCGELRTLVLPSEKQNTTYNRRMETLRVKPEPVDPAVYQEFELKVKNLTVPERKAAVKGFNEKRELAIKSRSLDEVEYYTNLLDILKKYEGGK